MKREFKFFIADMIDAIDKINEFIGDMDFREFLEDEKTKRAVVHTLEIMGEAAKIFLGTSRGSTKKSPGSTWQG